MSSAHPEGHSKVRDKVQHLKQRLRPDKGSDGPGSPTSFERFTSYDTSGASPDKVGWLHYRIVNFWHKGFFKLHAHYLTFMGDEAGKPDGVINLWNVQGIVLDNTDILLTLNEKALKRHGVRHIFAPHGFGGEPTMRLRAPDSHTAEEWLEAMQQSAVRGGPANGGDPSLPHTRSMHGPVTKEGWLVQRIQLQDGRGTPLHTVTALVDSGTGVNVLLGQRLEPAQALRVEVEMAGPGGQSATGVQPLLLRGASGDVRVAVPGDPGWDVCIAWQTERAEAGEWGVMLRSPQAVAVAGATFLAFLLSYVLALATAGLGAYWLLTHGPDASPSATAVDCFITGFTVEPTGRSTRKDSAATVAASPQRAPAGGMEEPADQSIRREEVPRLAELRAALRDLQAPDSGVSAAVYDKHVATDFRLVRYLRARPTVAAAAEMARESLRWRTAFGADDIVRTFRPEPWIMQYFGAPCFLECIEQGTDRLGCYQRDNQGHLTLYWRGGFVNYKSAFEALHGDLDHVMYLFVFVLEMIREDLDKLHVQTHGAAPSYISFVYDLEGFEYANQVPVSTLLAVIQRFFGMLNLNYPETIYRIHIVRAPWLFSSLWAVLKPVIPKDLLQKMPLSGGGKPSKVVQHLTPALPIDQIPKFLGGTLVDPDGNEECRWRIGPTGPFLPDKGRALFQQGLAHPPPHPAAHSRSSASRTTRRSTGSAAASHRRPAS
eukprot:EG_transcript_4393